MKINFIDQGTQNIIASLDANSPFGRRRFPQKYSSKECRIGKDEYPTKWLERFLNMNNLDIEEIKLCNNIVVLADLSWEQSTQISELTIEAVVSRDENLYDAIEKGSQADYFRFDFHPGDLGLIFAETHPHFHTRQAGPPRTRISFETSVCPVVEFLEFLYRSFMHEAWLTWAKGIWSNDKALPRVTRERVDVICGLFKSGSSSVLVNTYSQDVLRLKDSLSKEKASILKWRFDAKKVQTLSYP